MYVIFFNSVSDVFIGKKDTALQKFFFFFIRKINLSQLVLEAGVQGIISPTVQCSTTLF